MTQEQKESLCLLKVDTSRLVFLISKNSQDPIPKSTGYIVNNTLIGVYR